MPNPTSSTPCNDGQINSQIVFIGNVHLRNYTERDTRYLTTPDNAATMELVIDVIASPGYASVVFRDLRVYLEILDPETGYFIGHGTRNNYSWEVPVPGSSGDWYMESDTLPTKMLRIREDAMVLLNPSRPDDGKTYYVGIKGVPALEDIRFTAYATAVDIRATIESCKVTIDDLNVGESIRWYKPS